MTRKTAEDRLRYAKQYGHILTSLARVNDLLQFQPNKRIHIMKALSCLAIFTGQIEEWRQIRQRYRLSWSTGTEKIDAFNRFFDSSRSLDNMIQWHKEALRVLPPKHANFLLFCTLTGLRGSEAVESVKLVARTHQKEPYYNQETQTLEHFRYPEIFLRRTKSVYISIVNDEIIGIAEKVGLNPSLPGLKKAFRVRSLSMRVKYCRKIYASWLSNYGLQREVIDMLQGRVNSSVFSRHYLTSSDGLRDKVLEAVTELARKLEYVPM